MSLVMIERACERFRQRLSEDESNSIQATKNVDDVRDAIFEVERHLAAHQCLRNLGRLTPFLNGIDRLSKPLDVLCNGTPFLPYAWAPLKLILQLTQDHLHSLDKILSAYGSIGAALPRMSRYGDAFPNNYEFQQLLAHLYEDIIEFHSQAYRLLQKPGWKMFFSSSWGRFEHQFEALLQNIAQTSELIDKEATSIHIMQSREWRQKSLEDAMNREQRWEMEQREAALKWLEVGDMKSRHEDKLEFLRSRCREGTSHWITKSPKVRSWLQNGRGHPILWLHGKPGSGKSVLCSQLIYFLRSDRNRTCLFFFCDFHTASYGVTTQILKTLCAQMISLAPDLASFVYDECVTTDKTPSHAFLKTIIPKLFIRFKDVRIIIDGIDEVEHSQHGELIKTLVRVTDLQENCRLLFSSQDIPSINTYLKGKPALFIGAELSSVAKDLKIIVRASLDEINDMHSGAIPMEILTKVGDLILERAEGMFLWVHLVLKFLETSLNQKELLANVQGLPKGLAEAYSKIFTNIASRSSNDVTKQLRIFSWMLFSKGHRPLRKYELRLAMTLHTQSFNIDESTKPFPNALDICKPFIEDGPAASVVFIHSTLADFLTSYPNGPLINATDAHREISFGCLAQLGQSLCLVEQSSNHALLQYRIGQGFHALLPYAIEYGSQHLLDYVKDFHQNESIDTLPVVQQFLAFCREHNQLLSVQGSEGMSDLDFECHDYGLKCFEKFPEAWKLLNSILSFAKRISSADALLAPEPDPTLFSSMHQSYSQGVLNLMAQSSCPGLSQEQLVAFQAEYGPSAFLCHTRGCNRSVVGYPSASSLNDHEAQHRGTLKCPELNCQYNQVGFTSISQLRDHRRKRHPATGLAEIPRRTQKQHSNKRASSPESSMVPSAKSMRVPKNDWFHGSEGVVSSARPLQDLVGSNTFDATSRQYPHHSPSHNDLYGPMFGSGEFISSDNSRLIDPQPIPDIQQSPFGSLAPMSPYALLAAYPETPGVESFVTPIFPPRTSVPQTAPPVINIDFAPNNSEVNTFGTTRPRIDLDSYAGPDWDHLRSQPRSTADPLHLTDGPSPHSTPQFIRTSTINNSNGGNYHPVSLYSNKAVLKLQGKLDTMAENWTQEEWENRRRIVRFQKTQHGSTLTINFHPISVNERPPDSICISCIWWAERNECYVTSIDIIYLLEKLIASPNRFSVEERNRIRRNLEEFHPMTVSRATPETEEFFKTIMAFPNPKPRNIEKDVKVVPWKLLEPILKRVAGKYSAIPNSTIQPISTPPSAL